MAGRGAGNSYAVSLMRWTVHGERSVYDSDWMRVVLVDVEIPGGQRFEHHVLRMRAAAGTIVTDPERGVLLLWRHRFITDTWGWEIPGGRVEDDELPADAAAREAEEETGWRPGPVRHLFTFAPGNGHSDHLFHIYRADSATYVGDPVDASESDRIEWLTIDRIREEIRARRVQDGLSLTSLCWLLAAL
jgi:8-oxo-dGTP pyrophosphatase MutT (NUDIX family)